MPEIFSAAFLSALFAIVLIDLVLAGDNALIIGLVARNLPKEQQRKVIFWGTFGAIAVRGLMAILVVYILNVPGFMLAGGLALIWISRKLLTPDENAADAHKGPAPATSFPAALRTIVVADAVMGIDNVLAIGGAASGSIVLIIMGLIISVPIIVWGSHLVIRLVDRYPAVILLGGAVLAWTGYSMIVREPLLMTWLAAHPPARFVIAVLVFSLSLAPWWSERLSRKMQPLVVLLPGLLVWLLAFEVAIPYLKGSGGVLATDMGSYLIQAVRWLGWLPLAAAYILLRERAAPRTVNAPSRP
ncbi:TerC family protein [Reyranella sp.]|uniref:TerC family protein n=1 Tax=Reyranella sp. TaxID=1929291 RepID=UPI003D12205C